MRDNSLCKKPNLLFGGTRGIGLEIKKNFKSKKLITVNRSKTTKNIKKSL